MSISVLKKICIKYTAVKEARGVYGQYILERQKKNKETLEAFRISKSMEHLVISYLNECKKVELREKYAPKLYAQILDEYGSLNSLKKRFDEQKVRIEEQINEIKERISVCETDLNIKKEFWAEVNTTGIVTSQMGVSNMGELKEKMDDIKREIIGLESKKSKLKSELNVMESNLEEKMNPYKLRLKEFVLLYKNRIDRLGGVIDAVNGKYTESLSYYWYSFWNALQKKLRSLREKVIIEYSISFPEVCKIYDSSFRLKEKSELFCEQREVINEHIINIVELKISV